MKDIVKDIFDELFIRYSALKPCKASIEKAFELLRACYTLGGKVLICGNGGSAADSEHIVGELMKGFILERPLEEAQIEKLKTVSRDWEYLSKNLQGALPAISLVSQTAISTAFINDAEADMVFAQQVFGYGKPGDVLLGLTTSGHSGNVLNSIKVAKAFDIKTICMTGNNEVIIEEMCDVTIKVPETQTYKIQEYHLPVYHTLCAMLEVEFFCK